MPNLACNRASRGRPYERSRVGVAAADVVANRPFQFTDAAESSPPDALVGNFREETLHQIQPRSAGGREVPVITRMRRKPRLHHRMSVGAVVECCVQCVPENAETPGGDGAAGTRPAPLRST